MEAFCLIAKYYTGPEWNMLNGRKSTKNNIYCVHMYTFEHWTIKDEKSTPLPVNLNIVVNHIFGFRRKSFTDINSVEILTVFQKIEVMCRGCVFIIHCVVNVKYKGFLSGKAARKFSHKQVIMSTMTVNSVTIGVNLKGALNWGVRR